MDDLSDGPRSIKELLKISGPSTSDEKPKIARAVAKLLPDGSWQVDARVRVRRTENSWVIEPAVAFQQETGGGHPVRWRKLEAVSNCTVKEGRLEIPSETVEARFFGETDPDSHPVESGECSVAVEVRRAQKGGAE